MPQTNTKQYDFKGLADWVHIFSAGTQTDSKGRTKEFTTADLDSVVANHDAAHPAPHVITHKELYSPFAYGQSAELKREGDHLYVKSTKINPDFEKLVQNGALFERSVRLLPDGNGYKLGHIAWLGAEPPAVEGLAPVEFSKADDQFFDFTYADSYTPNIASRLFRRVRDFIIDKFDLETADQVVPEYEIESLSDHASDLRNQPEDIKPEFSKPNTGGADMPISQEEHEAAVAKARTDTAAEFSQQQTTLESELAAERSKNRKSDFAAKVNTLIDAGRLLPAQAEGAVDFMLALPVGEDAGFEFSRGEGDKAETVKKSPLDWFDDFMAALPVQVDMSTDKTTDNVESTSDFANPVGTQVDADRMKLHNKALDYQRKHQGVDYLTAVAVVEQQGG